MPMVRSKRKCFNAFGKQRVFKFFHPYICMKYYLIIGIIIVCIICVGLFISSIQPTITKPIIVGDNNTTTLATCADSSKKLVITDTPDGQIWECV
jgi:hypothetical protein